MMMVQGVSSDGKVNKTSLMCAIAAGNNELIKLLLQYGADINAMDQGG